MKWILIGLLLAAPMLSGCEKQIIHMTMTYAKDQAFEVDQSEVFMVERTITAEDVRAALNIPKEATITDVQIESLSLKVQPYSDNEANLVAVRGSLRTEQEYRLFDSQTFPLVGVNFPFGGLNSLIEDGIGKLREKIKNYVQRLNSGSATIILAGGSVPAGQRIHAQIFLKIRATIKYIDCISVPREVFNGQKCPSGPA